MVDDEIFSYQERYAELRRTFCAARYYGIWRLPVPAGVKPMGGVFAAIYEAERRQI